MLLLSFALQFCKGNPLEGTRQYDEDLYFGIQGNDASFSKDGTYGKKDHLESSSIGTLTNGLNQTVMG